MLLQDIEAVDPEYYKNLKWMLENDITDVLDLTFTAESDFFGKTEVGSTSTIRGWCRWWCGRALLASCAYVEAWKCISGQGVA